MNLNLKLASGQMLSGTLFSEPMLVNTVTPAGPKKWNLGLVGTRSERYREVFLTDVDLEKLTVLAGSLRHRAVQVVLDMVPGTLLAFLPT